MNTTPLSHHLLRVAIAFLAGMITVLISNLMKVRSELPDTVANFHKLYYDSRSRTWENTRWLGVPTEKCPLDLWIYQEIIYEHKPDLIIETGTFKGGSALFMANICDLVGNGRVVTIDIKRQDVPTHPRITYLLGSSTSEEIGRQVKRMVHPNDKIMVVLDSDHSKHHVLNELKTYGAIVTTGSYLIVEDTNLNGHPVVPGSAGPYEAVQEFLNSDKHFRVDVEREKFYLTFNPSGYLHKVQ